MISRNPKRIKEVMPSAINLGDANFRLVVSQRNAAYKRLELANQRIKDAPCGGQLRSITGGPTGKAQQYLDALRKDFEKKSYLYESLKTARANRARGQGENRINPMSRLYQTFHGNPPQHLRTVSFQPPRGHVVKLGRLLEVIYMPEGHSQHKGIAYVHKFPDWGNGRKSGERPILAVSANGSQLYVLNDRSKPKVGGRGIVG